MAKAKFKQIFETKWEQNKILFDKFSEINKEYEDFEIRKKIENEFQKIGKKVQRILYDGENLLCGRMSTHGKSAFAGGVAEKYWNEIKKHFKFIDHVGMIVEHL